MKSIALKKLSLLALPLVFSAAFGCGPDKDESTGEKAEDAAEEAGDAVEEGAEEVADEVDDATR